MSELNTNENNSMDTSNLSSVPSSGGIEPLFQTNESFSQNATSTHNYRHTRAYRHFKNPPQPHICIKVNTINGEELFINVLSWTRIVIPQEPSDPIPLYGGMKINFKVPPGSQKCTPLVYAVMANPQVLKDSGRHSKDPEERRAMVKLMCDFVEAMNPDIKLIGDAEILEDRDISGELKDVWNAVLAQRDREREELITQQRLQSITTQQMFLPDTTLKFENNIQNEVQNQTMISDNNKIFHMEFGPSSNNININKQIDLQKSNENLLHDNKNFDDIKSNKSAINNTENCKINKFSDNIKDINDINSIKIINDNNLSDDITDSNNSFNNDIKLKKSNFNNNKTIINNENDTKISMESVVVASTIPTSSLATTTNVSGTTINGKRERLTGFLQNGCHNIFPRFNKNNKHKDKDKDTTKTTNNQIKDKTFINSLKKTSAAAVNVLNKTNHHQTDTKLNYDKNCLNLDTEVEKLDLNKLDTSTSDNILIKLKVATSGVK